MTSSGLGARLPVARISGSVMSAHAAVNDRPRSSTPRTWMRSPAATRSSGETSSCEATSSNRRRRTMAAAWSTAGPTSLVMREAWLDGA